MIYTVTFNPAIDYVMQVKNFEVGKIHRIDNTTPYFGGKGINVSLVLNELVVKSVATGFTAGFTGEAIEQGVANENVFSEFVIFPLSGTTEFSDFLFKAAYLCSPIV